MKKILFIVTIILSLFCSCKSEIEKFKDRYIELNESYIEALGGVKSEQEIRSLKTIFESKFDLICIEFDNRQNEFDMMEVQSFTSIIKEWYERSEEAERAAYRRLDNMY